jgi:1-aminocyclopropane-1-carboxylate deaminase/D-cysteine desulfhydrase-like pyridoxal-dependent ACC family enzyme
VPEIGRVHLCCLPTPLHRLDRLSADLGIDLWVKRDDLTGFAGGGNKGRKLEYLIAEALAGGADTVVTCGSAQSNFVRQLGAACSVTGLKCVAAVMDLPYDAEHGQPSGHLGRNGGNLVLDRMFGVELRRFEDAPWETLFEHAEAVAVELEATGRRVYRIPVGGSSPLGAHAFALAVEEIGDGWDWIVAPCSSGSTFAGLTWGLAESTTRVVGIACDPEEDLMDDLMHLAAGLDELTGTDKDLGAGDFDLRHGWVGPGYGVASAAGQSAQALAASREGLLLDPVYSAKAFSGLIDLARSGLIGGRVLFWHTGGLPTLFAHDSREV